MANHLVKQRNRSGIVYSIEDGMALAKPVAGTWPRKSGRANLALIGRFLLAVAFLAFGVQYFIYATTGSGLGPPWTPEYRFVSYLACAGFLGAGAAFAFGKRVRFAGNLLAVLIVIRAVPSLVHLLTTPRDPGPWTSGFELLGISGACFVLAATSIEKGSLSKEATQLLATLGRLLFAASLIVFGVQHFLYAHFVGTLIPAWIPKRTLFAYFTGIAFFAAALAIAANKLASLASSLLAAMFLIWVVILHAPRVASASHNGDEWTSLFVALAMGASALIIAGAGTAGAGKKEAHTR